MIAMAKSTSSYDDNVFMASTNVLLTEDTVWPVLCAPGSGAQERMRSTSPLSTENIFNNLSAAMLDIRLILKVRRDRLPISVMTRSLRR